MPASVSVPNANAPAVLDVLVGCAIPFRRAGKLLKGDGTTAITSVRDMEIVGNYLYVSAQGVSVFDLSNPLAPTQVARWDATGTTYDMAVNGGNVYVGVDPAAGNHVLQVLSVPEPSVICLGAAAGVLGLLRRRRMR
jgi:hypothetical protein